MGVRAERRRLPDYFIETGRATVQMIRAVVGFELIGFTVQFKASLGQTIAKSTNQRAQIRGRLQVRFQLVKTQRNVGEFSVSIRRFNTGDDAAEINDPNLHA